MCAQEVAEQRSAPSLAKLLTWLGGGHWRELDERGERSAHAGAGAVVLFGSALAWLVASLAVSEASRWPLQAVAPCTLLFAVLVGAVARATATRPSNRAGVAGRVAVAGALGVVVGELAAIVLLSGSIDHRLDERALGSAGSSPPVAQASTSLQQDKTARAALDGAVDRARQQQDQALVVARCEYHPTPACPQTRITGDPGTGPETRTANDLLADAQRELDDALAARDRQAPGLDARIGADEQAVADARHGVLAGADRGLGARWVAMNDVSSAGVGTLMLRILTIASCVLIYLLPLILGRWRGETTHDRHTAARAERERAELEADTAIAVKRAEVRRAAEIMWAEHQLTQARLAIEAQTEIDRERQRRRVQQAIDPPPQAASLHRTFAPADDDMFLPIAAEAEAASRAVIGVPGRAGDGDAPETDTISENLPAPVDRAIEARDERTTTLLPSIPHATKAAARWIRPLVPPLVARVIDTTTQPLRTARQVFEEVEEITFAFRRTHRVTVSAESSDAGPGPAQDSTVVQSPPAATDFIHSSRGDDTAPPHSQIRGRGQRHLGQAENDTPQLVQRNGRAELDPPDAPRQLPPA